MLPCGVDLVNASPGPLPWIGGDFRAAANEFVESVGADGIFEVVEERSME